MQPPRILIVDREQKAALSRILELRSQGFDGITANDVVQGLSVAFKVQPAAVVLNNNIPAGGGVAMLKRMRCSADTACIPVIGIAPTSQREAMLSAGAQDVLAEPGVSSEIGALLRKHLGRGIAPQPPAEELASPDRLNALTSTGLLNKNRVTSFDEITALGARLIGVPAVMVSLVDKDRQLFKSHVGLSGPYAVEGQTPLSHSFCQWVVTSKEKLVVRDAREHPTLKTNRAIQDLNVVAYAGVPVLERNTQALGSFCALDSQPRSWTGDQLATLFDLAKIVEAHTTIQQEKHGGPDKSGATPPIVVQAVANGIMGATRILTRPAPLAGPAERKQLLSLITQLAGELHALNDSLPATRAA